MSKAQEEHRAKPSASPESAGKLSLEIFRLMGDGTPEGRKKAQELLQSAMNGGEPSGTPNGHTKGKADGEPATHC